VGGAARCGTTLVQSIFCSDPEINPLVPEAVPIHHLLDSCRKTLANLELFPGSYFLDSNQVKAFYAKALSDMLDGFRKYLKCKKLCLKEPALTPFFPLLEELLKDRVRFVCMVRDPRDAVASMLVWGDKMAKVGKDHFFQQRHIFDISEYYMKPFAVFLNGNEKICSKTLFLRYEDLVTSPGRCVETIRSFSGLGLCDYDQQQDWAEGKIDFADQEIPLRAAITELYGKPISRSRIGTFQNSLSDSEIQAVERTCKSVIDVFGYETKNFSVEPTPYVPPPRQSKIGDETSLKMQAQSAAYEALKPELPELRAKAAEYEKVQQEIPILRGKAAEHEKMKQVVLELRGKAAEYEKIPGFLKKFFKKYVKPH